MTVWLCTNCGHNFVGELEDGMYAPRCDACGMSDTECDGYEDELDEPCSCDKCLAKIPSFQVDLK